MSDPAAQLEQRADLKRKLGDRMWRLNNLYWITDKHGNTVKFRMNRAQRRLFKRMHNRNVILKARQLGFCLDPSTRVLTADLRWVPIGEIEPGQEVVAVDEDTPGGRGNSRKMRTGTVEALRRMTAPAYRIHFDDGRSVVCTGRHRWLSKSPSQVHADWRSIESANKKKLRPGAWVRWITTPWPEPDYEDGWFGGMIDGEGSLALPNRTGASVAIAQREGSVWERMVAYVKSRAYAGRIEADNNGERASKFGSAKVPKVVVSRLDEVMRLIGQTRPSRFIGRRFWEGKDLPGKRSGVGWSRVERIEYVGEQEVVDLQTSTKTFIAEGFVSHNSTFIQILMLDACLFNSNTAAGVIAQDVDTAQDIFDNKVKFAFERLPQSLQDRLKPKQDSVRKLEFANGSSMVVGTSMRSGTLQYLHVSELGKIAAKAPQKAKEIRTGSFEAVPQTGIIFVESTAEGREGEFFDLVKRARDTADEDRELQALDWRFHFYPWWDDPDYKAPIEGSRLYQPTQNYFQALADKHGITLTREQKAWYAAKEADLGEEMRREYPSHPDEAFEQAIEGAFYASIFRKLRAKQQITSVPHDDALPVVTAWDIGLDDHMAIWFAQVFGREVRLIDYLEDHSEGWDYYAEILRERAERFGYRYDRHFGPHDIEVRQFALEGTPTRKQLAAANGINFETVPRVDNHAEGRAAVRKILPMCYFDAEGCNDGIKALESYRREWDERLGTYKSQPRHDWASHGSKAFETLSRADLFGNAAMRKHARPVSKINAKGWT